MSTPDIGARIRQLRLINGLLQVEMGERVGVASGTISGIENGQAPVSSELLQSMARVLGCGPEFLGRSDSSVLTTRPWLRAYADAPKRQVDQQVADLTTAVEVIAINHLRRLPDAIPRFQGDLTDDDAIESFAREVRSAAGLDEGDVVGNSIRTAEKLGCLVLPMGEELGRHMGMSVWANQGAVICVSRPSEEPTRHVPGDRQRFTVAHEIGHLGLHSDVPAPQASDDASRLEKQAHRFAGAFLVPGDPVVEQLGKLGGRVTLRTLAELKSTWGVAIKALVIRLRSLGVIDDAHARSLYKQISARGWNKQEPIHVGNEQAIWFRKAASNAHPGAGDPLEEVARTGGIARRHLDRWTNWDPTLPDKPAAPVIELATRRRKT